MRISGGSIQHYRVGQAVSLVCRVEGLPAPPLALYWERGNKVGAVCSSVLCSNTLDDLLVKVVTAKHRPGSVLETEKLSGVSRVSLHLGSVELADTGHSC